MASPSPEPYDVLGAAAADWDRLDALLDAGTRIELRVAVGELRTAQDPAARLAAANRAARLLGSWLPGGGRYAQGPSPTAATFTAADLAVLVLDRHRMVGPVLGAVRDRLLAEPALTEADAQRWGADPADPRLIRLPAYEDGVLLPRFQFAGPAAGPWQAVLKVNVLLGADHDPWGVADWWLSPNAWLDTSPAQLLGTGRDAQLVDTARYETEDD
ncbi:hypothetical protein OG900_10540 [Streptomyces sp. NBC_00433]